MLGLDGGKGGPRNGQGEERRQPIGPAIRPELLLCTVGDDFSGGDSTPPVNGQPRQKPRRPVGHDGPADGVGEEEGEGFEAFRVHGV